MAVPPSAPILLTRNLLYTGITRAKKLLIIVGNDNVVNYMIQNIDSKKRNTGLEYKLKNNFASFGGLILGADFGDFGVGDKNH